MRPWLGGTKPAMMENSVVLPAPFGPISAVMRPVSATNDAWSTASSPPKRLQTWSTRSNGSAMTALQCRRNCAVAPKALAPIEQGARNTARRKCHDNDQHAAIDDKIKSRRIRRNELGELAKRLDDERAKQRAEHGAGAANDGSEQRLHRYPGAVGDGGIDEEEILHIEAAAGPGDDGRDGDGRKLDPRDIDAKRARRVLVFAHGDQPNPEPGALYHVHDHERGGEERKHDPIERRAALELERFGSHVELDQQPDASAGDGCNARDNAQDLREGQGDEGKIRAFQPGAETQRADDRAQQRRGCRSQTEGCPGIDAIAYLQDRSDIGAGSEKRGVTEGILAAIAAEHVPALPDECHQQRPNQEIEHDIGGRKHRHDGKQRHRQKDRCPASHARAPNRPEGRNSRARMNMAKMPIWPIDSPRKRPQRLSTTPTSIPPISAPATDPIPPSTTMVNAISTKALPACGLT